MRRLVGILLLAACRPGDDSPAAGADSAFAQVQVRGAAVMGVDQSASTHVFDDLPDGGRITYAANDPADTAAIHTIRTHLRDIAAAFAAGDFSQPAQVHGRELPGTAVMAARRGVLRYDVSALPTGAALRITTADAEALAAVRSFLAFQRTDHRAGGHDAHAAGMDHAAHMKSVP